MKLKRLALKDASRNFFGDSVSYATDHLGDFYGVALKPSTLDAFVARFVPPDDFSLYPELVETKWFGYRSLAPGQSLFLFIDRYKSAYQAVGQKNWGRKVSITKAGRVHVYNSQPIFVAPERWRSFRKGTMLSYWRAMSHADLIGTPYDFYCKTILQTAADRGWAKLPMPAQLYGSKMVCDVQDAWNEANAEYTTYTDHPYFKNPAFEGDRWQVEYGEFLSRNIRKRGNIPAAIYHAMIRMNALPPQIAVKNFGKAAVRDAIAFGKRI